jgi:hypothetical protein
MQNLTKNYTNPLGSADTAEMMVELKKRGYTVLETAEYMKLLKASTEA